MKRTIAAAILLLSGCGYQASYRERVFVKQGFYAGHTAVVISEHGAYWWVELDDGQHVSVHGMHITSIRETDE